MKDTKIVMISAAARSTKSLSYLMRRMELTYVLQKEDPIEHAFFVTGMPVLAYTFCRLPPAQSRYNLQVTVSTQSALLLTSFLQHVRDRTGLKLRDCASHYSSHFEREHIGYINDALANLLN